MAFIDSKGRLFGKINIVDFSVILLFLIIIPAFFYIYDVLGKRPTRVPYKRIKVEVVTFTLPEFAEYFKEGDILYDDSWNPNGKLLKIIKKSATYNERVASTKKGSKYKSLYRIPVFLELELKCTQDKKRSKMDEPWYYRRTPLMLSLDESFFVRTTKYNIRCYLMKVKD